jgi:hypothetical protein
MGFTGTELDRLAYEARKRGVSSVPVDSLTNDKIRVFAMCSLAHEGLVFALKFSIETATGSAVECWRLPACLVNRPRTCDE